MGQPTTPTSRTWADKWARYETGDSQSQALTALQHRLLGITTPLRTPVAVSVAHTDTTLPTPDEDTDSEDEAVDLLAVSDPQALNETPDTPHVRTLPRVLIGSAAVLAVLACAGGGVAIWSHVTASRTYDTCMDTRNTQRSAISKLTTLITNTQALTTLPVADASTTATLTGLLNGKNATIISCVAGDSSALDHATTLGRQQIDALNTRITAITHAAEQVKTSHATKMLTDAKNVLSTAITTATTTLDSSQGLVADNATLTTLRKALDQATTVLANTTVTDAKTYTNAAATLNAPIAAVEDSVAAKNAADAAAAAAEAQGAAGAQPPANTGTSAPAPAPSQNSTDSTPTPPSNTGGGWDVPATPDDSALPDHL